MRILALRTALTACALCLIAVSLGDARAGGPQEPAIHREIAPAIVLPGDEVTVRVTPGDIDSFYAVRENYGDLEFAGEHTADAFVDDIFVLIEPREFLYLLRVPTSAVAGQSFAITGQFWTDPALRRNSATSTVAVRGTTLFRRGDANGDGEIDISDGIRVLNFLFLGGVKTRCLDAMDLNDSAEIDISDGIYVFNFLFLGGPPPDPPGHLDCGPDPTEDALTCDSYPPC